MSSAVCHAVWYKCIDISENSATSHDISASFHQTTQHGTLEGKNFHSPPLESQISCKLFLSQCILRNHYKMEHHKQNTLQLQFIPNCCAFLGYQVLLLTLKPTTLRFCMILLSPLKQMPVLYLKICEVITV